MLFNMFIVLVAFLCISVNVGDTELLVNVKNQGGDVVQERLISNITENTIVLEFQRSDGTLVTMLIDFANDVEILRALVLGEEERGQSQYQVMCFVSRHKRGDFIPADAMARLRQKNPGAVRAPDEDLGRDEHNMDRLLDIKRASSALSRHIASMCTEAVGATYTRRDDLTAWAQRPGASESTLIAASQALPTDPPSLPCRDTVSTASPCQCRLELCIGWYPCGLRYCRGPRALESVPEDSVPSPVYRCGIRTCRRCHVFSYHVRQKQMCLWDE